MKSKLKTGSIMPLFSSWQQVSESFRDQWEFLKKNGLSSDPQSKTIWQTRFKDVQLISVPDSSGNSSQIVLKNYREKRFFRYFFRPSLAAREAAGFETVKSLGIPAVEVLAFGEKRFFGCLFYAFFITAYAENTETLQFFINAQADREALLKLLKENIQYLAKLHAAGFIHGGAHARNILWRKSEDGSLNSIWIDLATCRKVRHGKKYWKYILTDLSDMTEAFQLTQQELDMLMAAYRRLHPIPVCYKVRDDHEKKFSQAVKL